MKSSLGSLVAIVFLALGGPLRAEWIFLGPTPYLSAADSPFPVDGSNPNFYLEDFEDGLVNTPGIRQRNLYPIPGDLGLAVVQSPGIRTDSVDADDGDVDGLGRDGHSLASGLTLTLPTNPPFHQLLIQFEFDKTELGFLPTSLGFVWTDGPPSSSLSIRIVTSDGSEFVTEGIHDLGDASRDGGTYEDVFVGITGTVGFRTVTIFGGIRGELSSFSAIEIDHLQYGVLVPEPSTISLSIGCVGVVFFWFIHRRRRQALSDIK
jgi:hypothetical protein